MTTHRFYFCSLGSNVAPWKNVTAAVRLLLRHLPEITISPVIETAPWGMQSENRFCNALFWFESDFLPEEVKEMFIMIEAKLGRDRSHPESKTRDRPIDLDILYAGEQPPALSTLPLDDPYLEPFKPMLAGRPMDVKPMTLVLDGTLFGDKICILKPLYRGFRREPFPRQS